MPAHAAAPPAANAGQATTAAVEGPEETAPQSFPIEDFLDRLMTAESGGRLQKKNPRSTALGPFQFIKSTFLFVVDKHFQAEVAGLTEQQVLARRTDMAFSRRAARAYVHDLISALASNGLPASPVNVRIAFLVGPSAAVRLLGAPPDQPLKRVLSDDAIAANPFMSDATIAQLVQKAAVDVSATAATGRLRPSKDEPVVEAASLRREPAGTDLEAEPSSAQVISKSELAGTPIGPQDELIATASTEPPRALGCRIGLASCRRWIALQERKAPLPVPSAQQ
jgi:hypothetical protein